MGGYGSTRWAWHSKADTVEDCRVLDAAELTRKGLLPRGASLSTILSWTDTRTGKVVSSLGLAVSTEGLVPEVRLDYSIRGEPLTSTVRLLETRPNYGGFRWWFRCPLVVNGRTCGRRVLKLYLPPGGKWFGCRSCYRLTYTSCQEHDKGVDAFLRNPAAAREVLSMPVETMDTGTIARALKAIKAETKTLKRAGKGLRW